MKKMNALLLESVQKILALLVEGDYEQIERITQGIRISALDIKRAVTDYGRTLVAPPIESILLWEFVAVRGAYPPRWIATVPLWTLEEGRSDLSVALTLIEESFGVRIEVDDLHVL